MVNFGMFPKGMHSLMTLGFYRSRSATAIMTRWPEAFSRVVPEGDALAYDFRVRVGEVLIHS